MASILEWLRFAKEAIEYFYPRPAPPTTTPAPRKRRHAKCFICTAVLILAAATTIITVLILVNLKTPKIRIDSAMITSLNAGMPENPFLQATINAELAVKNPNHGRYKYRSTTVEFFYAGAKVGEVSVPDSEAGGRSTKKMYLPAALDLNVSGGAQLSADLRAGVVTIRISARMRGRVVFVVINRDKSISMNCSMQIGTATRRIINGAC